MDEWIKSHKLLIIVLAVTVVALIVIVLSVGRADWSKQNMTDIACWLTFLGVMVAIIASVVYSLVNPEYSGEELMPRWKRTFLMAYLLVFGAGLVFFLLSLTSLDFPETAAAPQEVAVPAPSPTATPATPSVPAAAANPVRRAASANSPTPTPTPVLPTLERVFPQLTAGNPPTQYLTVYGRNFQKDSEVRLNGQKVPHETLAANLLKVQVREEDVIDQGSIMVDLKNPDGIVSNAIRVPVKKPIVPLKVFFIERFWHPLITREIQLLLLVICAGALGSYLHAIMSIADFIGGRKLKVSWFWWYLTRPFLGMAMGLIFYAMLRGGFLVGTPADEKFVNPFGVVAIGALVGMFADRAAQKLGEIFTVVFQGSQTGRPDSLTESAPTITKLEPDSIAAESPDTAVKIIGEHLIKVKTVKVNDDSRAPTTGNDKEVLFTLTAADLQKEGELKITALEEDGETSASTIFTVTPKA